MKRAVETILKVVKSQINTVDGYHKEGNINLLMLKI